MNRPITPENWGRLSQLVRAYLQGRDAFVFDGFVGADTKHRLQVRVVSEDAWISLFAQTLFIRPGPADKLNDHADFSVIALPKLYCPSPKEYGINSEAFVVLNFAARQVIICGTEYAGEVKKSLFTVMNYLMPRKGVLSMHCSANVAADGESALFFGLSGTGKTTLSADPNRRLVGDDEHGWTDTGIFNFEGGCYAKAIGLSAATEPQIFGAIRFGSILENVVLDDRRHPDYHSQKMTENTRATYPVEHIDNCCIPGIVGHPRHIFFLAADAFGVLPPIARLTPPQAMYHFLSGYTAKLAGTEAGVKSPSATFSACFGAPFLVHHPFTYAEMLGERMKKHQARIWLVNTGWTGGAYGVGKRMSLPHTRALLSAALRGELNEVPGRTDPVFGLDVPTACPGVPAAILDPRSSWPNAAEYDEKARELAGLFTKNFQQFADRASREVIAAGPKG